LAVSVQLDGFEKVKKVMDTLIAEMKKQHEEEVKFKAYCQEEFGANEKATHAKGVEKKDLETTLDRLSAEIAKLEKEIGEAKTQVSETELAIKEANEQRENENSAFQTTVADQRATQSILKKALARLEDYYKKGIGKATLVQTMQEPPVKFNSYKDNAGSSPVMGLLEQIINDSKTLEAEATATDTQAQADYEVLVKRSNDLIAQLSEAITTKTKVVATAKTDTAESQASKQDAEAELAALGQSLADLHGECDFVVKHFEIRQKARLQEIEAIQGAKGILSGGVESR
jgi:chromosome segregation ATPase